MKWNRICNFKTPYKQKVWDQMASDVKSTQTHKEPILNFLKSFQKLRETQTHTLEATTASDTNTRQKRTKRENFRLDIFGEYRLKILNKIIINWITLTHKKDHTPWPSRIQPSSQGCFNIHKIHHTPDKRKEETADILEWCIKSTW